ncbi:hypothetical protein SUGI_1191730 [Cryptomeria japonica]|uniref:early nodulin-like protein 14 n=1 Tax=Cryptomeria japonica TaxID=3369 RepID=UPI0024148281|nr:early nodulin-like protein 14 [Cryptomeria japonica]GLJ55500.1 hypothetical protein SUGI_1191730 [Cryptomeria japonica]
MDNNISIFVAVIVGILFAACQGVLGRNHSVSWKICSNQSFDRVRGDGSNFLVGDTLVFSMEDENDGIARVMSESEYEECRAEDSKAAIYKYGEGIDLNESGIWYFMSRISDRCKSGEKVMISVVGGSVVRNRSLRRGGSGHGGGRGGSAGSGGTGTGTPGGFTGPKGGNRSRPKDDNAAAALTCSFLIVLLGLSLILFNVF